MNARALSVFFGVAALVAASTSTSRADDTRAALTPAQAAAKAEFLEEMRPVMQEAKKVCGVDVPLTTDFENFSLAAWRAAEFEDDPISPRATPEERASEEASRAKRKPMIASSCAQVYDRMLSNCRSAANGSGPRKGAEPTGSKGTPAGEGPTTVTSAIKRVECLFVGHQHREKNEEYDDYAQRNMSFANGVFTVHNDARLRSVSENVHAVVRPTLPEHHRKNGSRCTQGDQCRSYACSRGTCAPCGASVACGSQAFCSDGICYANRTDDDASSSSGSSSSKGSSKPKGAERGRMCSKGSECQSGSCKMQNRTRGTCQ